MVDKSIKPGGGKPDKLIRDALMAAIRQSPEKLKQGAEKILDRWAEGDDAAARFVADRIDGKAVQPIANDGENPFRMAVERIQRSIVDPKE